MWTRFVDISECCFQELYKKGYRYLIADKDNCLTLPYSYSIHPHVEVHLLSYMTNDNDEQ